MEYQRDAKRACRQVPPMLEVLPAEIIHYILTLISPSWWRTYDDAKVCHSLLAVCQTFRHHFSERVTCLQITNSYPALTPDLITRKIRACSNSLRVLTLTDVYFATAATYACMVNTINECPNISIVGGSFGPCRRDLVRFRPVDYGPRVLVMPLAPPQMSEHAHNYSCSSLILPTCLSKIGIAASDYSEAQRLAYETGNKGVFLVPQLDMTVQKIIASPYRSPIFEVQSATYPVTLKKIVDTYSSAQILRPCASFARAQEFGKRHSPIQYWRLPLADTFQWAQVALSSGAEALEFPAKFAFSAPSQWLHSSTLRHVVCASAYEARLVVCRLQCTSEVTVWVPTEEKFEAQRLLRPGLLLGLMHGTSE